MNWAVVMAGGNGTRFWPLSNPQRPKQFLRLLGNESPASACIERLKHVVSPERIIVVAAESHRAALAEALPEFPAEQTLWEPVGRNTAACIAWATDFILAKDADARIGVFPSDHAIQDVAAFTTELRRAYANAEGRIVLFGIKPTRPETGYGYIEIGEDLESKDHDAAVYAVASFREKPELEVAEGYLASGDYLWNSGMFIYDGRCMQEEISRYLPRMAKIVAQIVAEPERRDELFPSLESISIDYGVMERTQRAALMVADFPWDDLGTWDAIRRYFEHDALGNAQRGEVLAIDSRNCFSYACDGVQIATLGVEDLIIVATGTSVLVINPNNSQDVRQIVDALEKTTPKK